MEVENALRNCGNAVRSSNTTQSCRGDSLLLTMLAQTLGQSLSGWAASASGHIQPYSRGYRIFASIPRSCLNHLASLQHRQLFRLMKGECFSSSKLDSQTQLAGSVMCLCLLKTLRSSKFSPTTRKCGLCCSVCSTVPREHRLSLDILHMKGVAQQTHSACSKISNDNISYERQTFLICRRIFRRALYIPDVCIYRWASQTSIFKEGCGTMTAVLLANLAS